MNNKTCGDCKYFYDYEDRRAPCVWCKPTDASCVEFEPQTITNGDLIISGGMRELAKAMVYGYRETEYDGQVTDGMLYTWHLPNAKVFTEYNEAVDFLENWLNAPADYVAENGKSAKQADLCCKSAKESEKDGRE